MPRYRLLESSSAIAADIDESELQQLYRHPDPGDRPWVRTNFVSTLDGAVQGSDHRSGTINTGSDHLVFALQRALAEVILVGAGTVRAEGYRAVDLAPWQQQLRVDLGLDPFPTLAILSGSCAVSEDVAIVEDGDGGPVLIMTGDGSAGRRPSFRGQAEVVEVGAGTTVPVTAVIAELGRRGMRRVLCEGGPHLNWQLHAAGLVDDVCLTVSPMVIGGDGSRTTHGALIDPDAFRIHHVIAADDGALLLRYLR